VSGGYVIIMRNITHELLLEEEKDEFIGVVSHELRTPVTVAEGGISNSLLLAQREHLNPLIIKNLETAHGQAVFLSNMLNDLATLSRAERGKMSLVVEQFKVNELLQSLVEDHRPQAMQKKLTIECNLCEPDVSLSSSRLYVSEILQNFITNSIKYTEKGGITLSAQPAGSGVEFSVKDTGIGIGRNEHAKLFDKFFRSSDWRVKKIKGTGIGLYVSDKLSRLIDGKISFESELNRGSEFKLYAPNISPVVHAGKQGTENTVANT
jgi:two-component system, OmpR family, phosphate regulon sensor histidine kinase PhoR